MTEDSGKAIACRSFFQAGDESKTPIMQVNLCSPVPSPHRAGEFMCSYQICSEQATKTETVYGIDELQALQLALADMKATIDRLNKASGYQLRWLEDESADLGMAIPQI